MVSVPAGGAETQNLTHFFMLGPKQIAAANYPVAVQPLLGFEQQLFITTQPFTDVGVLTITGVNSGTYTANAAPAAQLAAQPQELLCLLETPGVLGDSPLVAQVVGTDSNGNPLSGVATFTPPGYAQDKSYDIHQHRAAEFIPYQNGALVDLTQFKTVISVTPITASAAYLNAQFRIAGMPLVSSLKKIGTKLTLEFDEKIQQPVAIRDGKDLGAYVKPGEIPVGDLTISANDPVSADGLRRFDQGNQTGHPGHATCLAGRLDHHRQTQRECRQGSG